MALTDENGGLNVSMPVAPAYGGGGFGGFGDGNWSWLIVLFLFAMFGGGWGNGGGFGGGYEFPWVLNGQNGINNNVNDGFRDQMLNSGINGIQQSVTSGFGDVQTALCGGFAGVNASINGAQNALAQQLYSNQLADLERSFAAQTASTAGMTSLSQQLATCCCENRAAVADVKYTIANEGCATRATSTANTQAILDKLCALEIDAKNDKIAELERQLTIANLAASQTAQTAALVSDNAAQTQYIVNRVAPYPIPAYTVANPVTPATTG